jgi:hypothetical protein
MARVMVSLREDEVKGLRELAERERRDPRDQAALCIRYELQRRGLLSADGRQTRTVGGGDGS